MANRSDNFNRADGVGLGTPSDGGSAWQAISGGWGISGNAAYSDGSSQAVAVLEASASDATVQAKFINLSGGQDIGLCARVADDNNYILGVVGPSVFRIYKKVGGSYSQVGSDYNATPTNGDVVAIECLGTAIALKVNGVTRISGTVTELATNTKFGIRANSYTDPSFDDFAITVSAGGGPDVSVALSGQSSSFSQGSVTASVPAVSLTIPAMKDLTTGTLRAGEAGVTVMVNDLTTGALVVKKTGQTTHAVTGVCTVTDPLLVSGTTYRVTTILSDGSEGTWKYTAS